MLASPGHRTLVETGQGTELTPGHPENSLQWLAATYGNRESHELAEDECHCFYIRSSVLEVISALPLRHSLGTDAFAGEALKKGGPHHCCRSGALGPGLASCRRMVFRCLRFWPVCYYWHSSIRLLGGGVHSQYVLTVVCMPGTAAPWCFLISGCSHSHDG